MARDSHTRPLVMTPAMDLDVPIEETAALLAAADILRDEARARPHLRINLELADQLESLHDRLWGEHRGE